MPSPPDPSRLYVSSVRNPRVRQWLELQQKSRARRQAGLFVVEGVQEIALALRGGYTLESLWHCPTLGSAADWEGLVAQVAPATTHLEVTPEVFAKMAYRDTTGGVLAIAHARPLALDALHLRNNALVLVAEGIEKPGNLGALLRTADAARLDAVLVADPKVDFYNPNVIRASVGTVFTRPLAAATSAEAIAWLQQRGFCLYATELEASVPYHTVDYRGPSAIVMGTEATGLSQAWRTAADARIIIPMQGVVDSLNVSVSAAVVIFEACRQRGFA